MKKIQLGNSGVETTPIILGGNVFGWTIDEKKSFEILDKFLELGFETIDTADYYSRWVEGNSGGESEKIIGKWMKDRGTREHVNIITKVGLDMGQGRIDLSEKHILKAAEDSLSRLGVDQIDLYLSHRDDDQTSVAETLGAYKKLIDQGKIRACGCSNFTKERLQESIDVARDTGLPRYEVTQPEYNLFDRKEFETTIADLCQAENIGVITYYSLASGFLSGKYTREEDLSKSVRGGGVEKYLNERGFKILNAIGYLAKQYNVSYAAIALAWQIALPTVAAPIASATKIEHLNAFKEAVELELTEEDMKFLDSTKEIE